MRAVCSDESALPAGEVTLVHQVEEVQRPHGGIARKHLDQIGVDLRLCCLVRDGRSLGSDIEAGQGGRNRHFPADLVELEHQRLREALHPRLGERRLGGPVKRVPDRLPDPVEIHNPGVRPAVPLREAVLARARVRVVGDLVHQRLRPATRPVGRAEVVQKPHRRARDVRARVRIVVAARREADTDDVDARIDRLERVVGPRKHRLVCGGGERPSGGVELRLPEIWLVRLVPDHEILHLGKGERHLLDELGELRRSRGRGGEIA